MSDLTRLLDAASPEPDLTDAREDLRRGRAGLRRRRVRQARLGGTGLAAAVLVAGLALQGGPGLRTAPGPGEEAAPAPSTSAPAESPSTSPSARVLDQAAIRLVSRRLEAGPFTFGKTPQGWATQGQDEFAATIAPTDGSVSPDPGDYLGKITVMMASPDQPVRPPGSRVVRRDGRPFIVSRTTDGGATWVTTPAAPGDAAGRVQVQFWRGGPWDERSMVAFTASVRVTGEVLTPVG